MSSTKILEEQWANTVADRMKNRGFWQECLIDKFLRSSLKRTLKDTELNDLIRNVKSLLASDRFRNIYTKEVYTSSDDGIKNYYADKNIVAPENLQTAVSSR